MINKIFNFLILIYYIYELNNARFYFIIKKMNLINNTKKKLN